MSKNFCPMAGMGQLRRAVEEGWRHPANVGWEDDAIAAQSGVQGFGRCMLTAMDRCHWDAERAAE